jgi:hypothetical protein
VTPVLAVAIVLAYVGILVVTREIKSEDVTSVKLMIGKRARR